MDSFFGLTTLQFFGLCILIFGTVVQFVIKSRDTGEGSIGPVGVSGKIGFIMMFTGIIIFVFGTVYNY